MASLRTSSRTSPRYLVSTLSPATPCLPTRASPLGSIKPHWNLVSDIFWKGAFEKAGTRVRVTGQLVDCGNGRNLWADRYDRNLTDIFTIQDEITHAIVEQLRVKLLPEERTAIGRAPTENVEAYTYYLRGRQFSYIWTKSYLLLARRMFSRAVELDPHMHVLTPALPTVLGIARVASRRRFD